VLAISAYLTWLSRGAAMGKSPAWRGQNAIPAKALVPVDKLDVAKGEAIYTERCATCHGPDGQGVQIGDKIAGPLWGPRSWNDGAGAARVYTLAGIIRYSMPYLDPGNITDEDAQHVAAFINSKPRPAFPFKDRDYRVEKLPPDAVYYTRLQSSARGGG
jgi:thiosulfate dehydrogenase